VKNEWIKTPKHILRFDALQQIAKNLTKGTFIEFGAGTGDFTTYFLDRRFSGTVYDIDDRTINILKENLYNYSNVNIVSSLGDEILDSYNYLFAFEVLEHIENALEALLMWANYLQSDGTLLISVPAHKSKFSEEDKRVGHIRRYEKDELIDIVEKAGFHDIEIINYGFPLGNITRVTKNLINKIRQRKSVNDSKIESSIKSGIERDSIENKLNFFFNPVLLTPFLVMQRLFFKNDLGDGYLVLAIKQ